jgi:hypothetical protein
MLIPSEFLLVEKYWNTTMPTTRKLLAFLSVGQFLRVLLENVAGIQGAKPPPDQFFVVVNESDGAIRALHSTVLLEQMLKQL